MEGSADSIDGATRIGAADGRRESDSRWTENVSARCRLVRHCRRRAQSGARCERAGADFIKVYDNLSRDAYFAITSEAKRLKIPVAGTSAIAITPEEASNAGQVSIDTDGS